MSKNESFYVVAMSKNELQRNLGNKCEKYISVVLETKRCALQKDV